MRNRWTAAAIAALLVANGAEAQERYGMADFSKVPKFDAHVHYNYDSPAFITIARKDGFELLSINVDYPDFPPLDVQARITRKYHSLDPKLLHYSTTFSMKGFGTPGWTERVEKTLDQAFANGAIAVKVWKNIGMVERDAAGKRVFLDDPRFDPMMAHIRKAGVPLIAQQGEPRNCWLPLDQMTTDNDRTYFRDHPEYYMYLHPDEPSYEMIMAARDRFVAFHPDLPFVGAHLASLEWNVDRIATFLDRFPNATVDMAARMSELQNQSRQDYGRVRNFIIKYQDRLLYGTALTFSPPDPDARAQTPPMTNDFESEADTMWRSDWRYLATPLSQHIDAIDADVKGLDLPRSVIDKIYHDNAYRVFLHKK